MWVEKARVAAKVRRVRGREGGKQMIRRSILLIMQPIGRTSPAHAAASQLARAMMMV